MNSPCKHEPLSPAVQRCCDARNRMIELDRRSLDPNYKDEEYPEIPKDNDPRSLFEFQAKTLIRLNDNDPSLAYRAAMPEPIGRRQIKQYIACVTHGLAIEAITPEEARNMLYAARAATLALSKYKRDRKQPASSLPSFPPGTSEYVQIKALTEHFRANKSAN
jgi:hypothetical protein